ncbi:MAG: DUF1904 family protein [Spirochaetota bacterium]
MPHIRLRNVDSDLVRSRASTLIDRLTEAVGCQRSWFTVEILVTTPIDTGLGDEARPFAEVLWFRRPIEIRKLVATILSEELRGDADYLTTVFFDLVDGDYFENGEAV